ncbi:MAG: gluconate 2-dehydrogenase subunit 3 family protein [Sandarakinorhabdus sp.]|nr:gluconate 2-dehydrogenase subunit 3 family protein [Sandarakinorhabdus sp.]
MTRDDRYPANTVRSILDTPLVTPATSAALRARLAEPVGSGVFDALARKTLRAACDGLIPQSDRSNPIDLASIVESRLANGDGDGWRYADMPDDVAVLRSGLAAIDASAHGMFGAGLADLDTMARDRLLTSVQHGDVPSDLWTVLDPKRWFETLLVAVTEAYYAHPLAQEEIGYLGMADARGWSDVGLGARAPHEPEPL